MADFTTLAEAMGSGGGGSGGSGGSGSSGGSGGSGGLGSSTSSGRPWTDLFAGQGDSFNQRMGNQTSQVSDGVNQHLHHLVHKASHALGSASNVQNSYLTPFPNQSVLGGGTAPVVHAAAVGHAAVGHAAVGHAAVGHAGAGLATAHPLGLALATLGWLGKKVQEQGAAQDRADAALSPAARQKTEEFRKKLAQEEFKQSRFTIGR
jgi:hypothetical protein